MEISFKQVINKVTAELKFRPKLASWENTLFVAELFELEFPDWQIDKGVRSQILLFSKDTRDYLNVAFNSLQYGCENQDDVAKFKRFLKLASDKFAENKIEIYQSFAYRNVLFYESDLKYTELSDILFTKFYSSAESLRAISADVISDVAFVLDAEKNGFKNNCRFGPMLKTQVLENFKSPFEFDDSVLNEDKVFLYLDIGVHVQDPVIDSLRGSVELLENLATENKRIVGEYIKLIKSIT